MKTLTKELLEYTYIIILFKISSLLATCVAMYPRLHRNGKNVYHGISVKLIQIFGLTTANELAPALQQFM